MSPTEWPDSYQFVVDAYSSRALASGQDSLQQPVSVKEGKALGYPFLESLDFLVIAAYAVGHKACPHTVIHSTKEELHPTVMPV